MPLIPKFRINNYRADKDDLDFYVKVNSGNNNKLLNLCISGDGIYYYKPGSQILTPKENRRTRNTYDGYLTMPVVKEIFEKLAKAGWTRKAEEEGEVRLEVKQTGNKITIEVN